MDTDGYFTAHVHTWAILIVFNKIVYHDVSFVQSTTVGKRAELREQVDSQGYFYIH